MQTPFAGIWPAMLTPLDESGHPALEVIDALVELFVSQGLDGLYVLGSTGQGPLLNVDERRAAAERVVRSARGRIPVMVHVGAAATADAVALARHAAQIGADAVSSVAPFYYAVGPDAVFEHYRRIGAATDLPLFVYHLAAGNRLNLDARAYADRLLELPNIAGMKYTDPNLFQFGLLCARLGDRLTLFSGADELLCHAALCGAAGAIGTFYNLWGPACRSVRAAFVGGSVEAGMQFMRTFQPIVARVLSSNSVWTFLRSAMHLKYKIDVGPPRPPLGTTEQPWDEQEVARLVALVDEYESAA